MRADLRRLSGLCMLLAICVTQTMAFAGEAPSTQQPAKKSKYNTKLQEERIAQVLQLIEQHQVNEAIAQVDEYLTRAELNPAELQQSLDAAATDDPLVILLRSSVLRREGKIFPALTLVNRARKLSPGVEWPDASLDQLAAALDESREFLRNWRSKYWVHRSMFLLVLIFTSVGIYLARRGKYLPIRDIPGLMVFEEAIGRATEMGRPTFFTCGGCCSIQTVELFASMPILRHVAKICATYKNRFITSVAFPETLTVHRSAARDGYLAADNLSGYNPSDIRFFPGGQFFWAIMTMGYMLRERPAACFYFGWWEADSLMISETGQTLGAIQIAATNQLYQIPFFVAACDYVLIGEEFYAASSYVSRDPLMLGSISAQDIMKLLIVAILFSGPVLASVCVYIGAHGWLKAFLDWVITVLG